MGVELPLCIVVTLSWGAVSCFWSQVGYKIVLLQFGYSRSINNAVSAMQDLALFYFSEFLFCASDHGLFRHIQFIIP